MPQSARGRPRKAAAQRGDTALPRSSAPPPAAPPAPDGRRQVEPDAADGTHGRRCGPTRRPKAGSAARCCSSARGCRRGRIRYEGTLPLPAARAGTARGGTDERGSTPERDVQSAGTALSLASAPLPPVPGGRPAALRLRSAGTPGGRRRMEPTC